MPSYYYTKNGDNIKFEYDSDDDFFLVDTFVQSIPRERRIAGSKRVARYRDRMEQRLAADCTKGSEQLLQSITAQPALSSRSFEVCCVRVRAFVTKNFPLISQELRVECYAQSFVAQGKPPASVDAMTTPDAVIPPLFNAYPGEIDDDILPNEITMAN